jgi:transposase
MGMLDDYADQICCLAAEGKSDERIAAELPVETDGQSVYRWRKKHHVGKPTLRYASVLDPYADDIRRMYVDEGLTDQHIADTLPVSVGQETIRAYRMKRLGIASDRQRKVGRFTMAARYEELRDELPAAWERSKKWHSTQNRMVGSAQRVAQEFGVSTSTAAKWLAEQGLVEKRIDGKAGSKQAVALFGKGSSVPKIAEALGATQDSVRNWLKAAGCDLSDYFARMSHEEKIAWRRSISEGKASSVAGSGRYSYGGARLDSPQEVIFAKTCDRLGMDWQPYDRASMGVCEVLIDDRIVRYAPDFLVGNLPVEVKGIYDGLAADKVRTWREERGPLALVMKEELFEFEAAASAKEARLLLDAACFLDPSPETAFWQHAPTGARVPENSSNATSDQRQ